MMRESNQLLLGLLRWAAGAAVPFPGFSGVDNERFLELTTVHRLAPRCLRRLAESQNIGVVEPGLTQHLRLQNAKTIAEIQLRIAALSEICEQFEPGEKPIVLKGFSAYAATGDNGYVRPSADIDLLVADVDKTVAVLERLGYEVVFNSLSAHECATAARRGIAIEIHRFFPAYSIPDELWRREQRHCFIPSPQCYESPQQYEITYSDLRETCVPGKVAVTENLLFPSVTWQVFLLCVHEFKDFILSPFESSIPVRIALLAEILMLAENPNFDDKQFGALVKKLKSETTIRLIDIFLAIIFGRTLQLYSSPFNKENYLPRQLSFRGGWGYIMTAKECLLGVDKAHLLKRSLPYSYSREGSPLVVDIAQPLRGQNEIGFLNHSMDGNWGRGQCVLRWQDNELIVQFDLPELDNIDHEYRVRIDVFSCFSLSVEFHIDNRGRIVWQKGLPGVKRGNGCIEVALAMPVKSKCDAWITIMRRDNRKKVFYNVLQTSSLPVVISS